VHRRRVTLPAALCLLAGCGSGGSADAPEGSIGEAASLAPTELISVPWRLAAVDGKRLELKVAGAGCVSFQDLTVTESPKKVTIRANAVTEAAEGTFCSQEVTTEDVPRALTKPLGDRALVHAPVSPAWDGPKDLGPDKR
jgi:hypothetical protein